LIFPVYVQLVICATAHDRSGAMAERTKFSADCLYSIAITP
jgi:ammonia channel protein AmtB